MGSGCSLRRSRKVILQDELRIHFRVAACGVHASDAKELRASAAGRLRPADR